MVLIQLCKLYGISCFLQYCSPVIEKGLVSKEHILSLNECKEQLIGLLRGNMVGLVDSFMIPDSRLRSHLTTGNPYEVLCSFKCRIILRWRGSVRSMRRWRSRCGLSRRWGRRFKNMGFIRRCEGVVVGEEMGCLFVILID